LHEKAAAAAIPICPSQHNHASKGAVKLQNHGPHFH